MSQNALNIKQIKSKVNIVLYQPEIPFNTGNILRTCVAFKANLHLIRPYGFFLNDKRMQKASTDYWKNFKLFEHDDFNSFLKALNSNDEVYYLTKLGNKNPDQINLEITKTKDFYFVFGQETKGLPKILLNKNLDKCLRIPISLKSRCLNLSNSVACLIYEVMRQNNFKGLKR